MNAGSDVTVQPFEFEYAEDLSSLTENWPAPAEYVIVPPLPQPGSTSGCELADFAGFPAGAIALIQRGSCGVVVEARNAENVLEEQAARRPVGGRGVRPPGPSTTWRASPTSSPATSRATSTST